MCDNTKLPLAKVRVGFRTHCDQARLLQTNQIPRMGDAPAVKYHALSIPRLDLRLRNYLGIKLVTRLVLIKHSFVQFLSMSWNTCLSDRHAHKQSLS
jgi:hypothetical protein